MYYGFDSYYLSQILLIPALIFTFYAQMRVKSNFNKYSKVRNNRNLTGAEAARIVLDANGLQGVRIEPTSGSLTDHYDPRQDVLRLSETVYGVNSVAAIGVACHEAGHAIQHATGYIPVKVRGSLVPITNFASNASWILVILGVVLLGAGNASFIGDTIFNIGIIMMLIVILFHTVTLPVEFNASRRALQQMRELSIIYDDEEVGARKVLRAAALTYVAALAVAIGNLLRMLAIRGRR